MLKARSVIFIFIKYLLFVLCFLSLSRISLTLLHFDRVISLNDFIRILISGMRVDTSLMSYAFALPCVFSIFLLGEHFFKKIWIVFIKIWMTFFTTFIVMMEVSTPQFINEYGIRPNRLFFEYLIYPKEVFSTLYKNHLFNVFLCIAATAIAMYLSWKWLSKKLDHKKIQPIKFYNRIFTFLIVGSLFFIGLRSSFGHRPLNPSMVYFSTDPLINSLTLNSSYSLSFALKQLKNESKSANYYGDVSTDEVIQAAQNYKGYDQNQYTNKNIPTLAFQKASYRGKPKNLVIILHESLSAIYTGALGGKKLTPNIDKLYEQGWAFTNLYATGVRSVRGLEAVVSGYTPTPRRAVLKLSKSQHNFFTIASLLKNKGYFTQFVYGGESHFDNMKSFFLGNGFQSIIEQSDYENPNFVATWGASDEDLFNKAHLELEKNQKKGKPFFNLIFTSSNHDPFEYPAGRIPGEDKPVYNRENAIHYADWATGEFLKKAKKSDYWKNTVFILLSDHNARVLGKELVPVDLFHIPGVIFGEGIPARKYHRVSSHIDIAPTLLSLMGIDNWNPMLGRDLTKEHSGPGSAMMQYSDNFALLEGNKVTILQPEKTATEYIYNKDNKSLIFQKESSDLDAKKARLLSAWGSVAYDLLIYRLPKSDKNQF